MSRSNENRRKVQVAQLAKQVNKKIEDSGLDSKLVKQYKVIREDIVKLRNDLNRGYDMAKEAVDKKTLFSGFKKLKGNK